MKDHSYFIRKALEVADSAPGFKNRQKTGCVIVEKDRIIARGVNSEKTHPLAATFSKHPLAVYLHAEIDAIIKAARKGSNFSSARIYIARRTYNNNRVPVGHGLAKPCSGCAAAIAHFNFGFVGYSLDSDSLLHYATVDRRRNSTFVHMECS
jgi:tRNA(Arg) A34 adenosine deaminase TadA